MRPIRGNLVLVKMVTSFWAKSANYGGWIRTLEFVSWSKISLPEVPDGKARCSAKDLVFLDEKTAINLQKLKT
jgi:hypothetical protein